jgi:hypothetical protein
MRLRSAAAWAGVVAIVATNAAILAGVAHNRVATPDAELRLTQRELAPAHALGTGREDSGLALRLLERTARMPPASAALEDERFPDSRMPDWLDEERLAALGIDVKRLAAADGPARGGRPTAKQVLLVLELDGAAYASALARARQRAEAEAALAAANPGKEEFVKRARNAADAARREETERSRLFVVDAGLDREALRARYPDRRRHAIVRGTLQPLRLAGGKVGAMILRLGVDEVSVPLELRPALDAPLAADLRRAKGQPRAPFEATLAWGRRLEPWIVDAGAPAAR